jgi:orotate phosphoribosyltransferase-like protein
MEQNGTKWNETTPLTLSDVQIRAIELILKGLSDTEIAKILKIGRNTLWRWKTQNFDFCESLDQARDQLHTATMDGYQSVLLRATGVLDDFLSDHVKRNRLRAAQIVLNMAGCFRPFMGSSQSFTPSLPPKQG